MTTTLLYHRDAGLLSFDAAVVAHGAWQGTPSVVLDQTAFYPEAGGQLADHGVLAGVRVRDVQIDDDGVVHHLVDGALPAVGARVTGAVDKSRRRQFAAQHTAQHMLSRALLDEAKAETVSARLGETVCTVDVSVPALADSAVGNAEALANSIVDDDVLVRAYFPNAEELAALPLRRSPKVSDHIRVVAIGAFDVSPCGGTHCTRTAQVGMIRVVGLERTKGMMRVSFQAGARARIDASERAHALEALARDMSTSADGVASGIDKLRQELKAAREDTKALVGQLAELRARALVEREAGDALVLVVDEGVDMMRVLAARIAALGKCALLATPQQGGLHVVLARGGDSTLDCGALLKTLTAAHGGKGGGKRDYAEGRIASVVDWHAAVASARAR